MIRSVGSEWRRTLVVCGKCSKHVDGGFGRRGRTPLAKALLKALKAGRGRKARIGIVESRCLGLCPKRGVVLIDATVPAQWHVVEKGVPIDEVIDRLALRQPARERSAAVPSA